MTVPVTFRFRGAPGQRVELFGDLPTWDRPHLMPEVAPGEFSLTLDLPPGIHRWKFLVDWRRWTRDVEAPVDWTEGVDNSIVIVDGTRPPLFFATDRRHLQRFSDGRLVLHFECDERAVPPERVWLRVEEIVSWAKVATHGVWRGRVLCSAELPLSTQAQGTFGFEGWPEFVFATPQVNATSEPPKWLSGTVWYGIFLDRWFRGGATADPRVVSRDEPTSATTFYGGDLEGARQSLPALKALGVDGVVLTPLQPSETPHRYDTVDHHAIDERLGGEPALRRLIRDAHRKGLKVCLDVSFTHVHEDHPFWKDVLQKQKRSRTAKWFQVKRFPVKRGDVSRYAAYANRPELPLLDLTFAPARKHVIDAAVKWVKLGVDALRLDAMTDAPPVLWQELRAAVRKVRRDVALLGEVVMDVQPFFSRDLGADAVTDFQHREALLQLLEGTMRPETFAGWTNFLEHRQGPLPHGARLRFLDNHDTSRLGSLVDVTRVRFALAWLLLRPEPAWLTAGTEFDLAAGVPLFRLDDAWPERIAMPALDGPKPETAGLISDLLRLRRELLDDDVQVVANGSLLSFQRTRRDGRAVTVVFNCSDGPVPLDLDGEVLLSVNEPAAAEVGPWCARVIATS
jgi:glycosidase